MDLKEHLMVVAIEECAEIQQAFAKVMRFGLEDYHPEKPEETNEDQLLTEFYQLIAMVEELQEKKLLKTLPKEMINAIKQEKLRKVYHYMNYSKEKGLTKID